MMPSLFPKNFNGIAVIGEAPGEQEEKLNLPFVGASGQELTRMLQDADIVRGECFFSNVFRVRPASNNIEFFCTKEKTSIHPSLARGLYVKDEYKSHIDQLKADLLKMNPYIIIALGNTALWALCQTTAISKLRGAIAECKMIPGLKVLPTYHPAYVLRDWSSRPIVVADLMKAKQESGFRAIKRPERQVYVPETRNDLFSLAAMITLALNDAETILAVDIETARGQITCIGFSYDPSFSIVVPFVNKENADYSYWGEPFEQSAWTFVREVLNSPCKKLFHNGLFDVQYLYKYGCTIKNFTEDTMLLHHSMFSELQKGLDFLGSIYTAEPAWKLMRQRGEEKLKKDE